MSKRTEKVDIEYINSEAYRCAFDFFEDATLGDVICEVAREMLKHRTGTSLEDFAAISISKKHVVTRLVSSKTHNEAVLTNENRRAMSVAKRGDLVTIHNHPENMPPSSADFRLCLVRSVRYGIIAGHNGSVVRYRIVDREKFLMAVESRTMKELDGFILRNVVYYGTRIGDAYISSMLERRFGVSYERIDTYDE
ncbi:MULTISPECIES: hypothetical protein [Gordonibacter]|uniref:JAB domain-containing protein n=1 Tax=Gordonibacter faecis TaxID=3047475 RepID=A0ABT7DNZ9_9ACTN|nr:MULTISPECIES: hypothetical protein [unclassified Gordonibacter]MDJ1650957.1 hypothetical protein [Gordonibacter sp. KGMB12511]